MTYLIRMFEKDPDGEARAVFANDSFLVVVPRVPVRGDAIEVEGGRWYYVQSVVLMTPTSARELTGDEADAKVLARPCGHPFQEHYERQPNEHAATAILKRWRKSELSYGEAHALLVSVGVTPERANEVLAQ